MLRASVILKNARQDKDLELIEVSKKLKIQIKYLESIESENKSDFPNEPYCSLIIKDYANFLGLNGEEVLSLFRRDFANKINMPSVTSQKISFTPQFTFKIAVTVSILIFALYLVFEYVKFNRPPMLKVNWPDSISNQQLLLEITGITDPESTVRVNNDLVIIDATGSFRKKINISDPSTTITIESKSQSGKTTLVKKTYNSQ